MALEMDPYNKEGHSITSSSRYELIQISESTGSILLHLLVQTEHKKQSQQVTAWASSLGLSTKDMGMDSGMRRRNEKVADCVCIGNEIVHLYTHENSGFDLIKRVQNILICISV